MDTLEYAKQMELDGQQYYRDLALSTPNKGLKSIFTMLAEDEGRHYDVLCNLKNKLKVELDTNVFTDKAKSLFKELENNKDREEFLKGNQLEVYEKAKDIELKSITFYTERAKEANNDTQKEIFNKLISEEKKHFFILDNLAELITRPKQWVESAEFGLRKDY